MYVPEFHNSVRAARSQPGPVGRDAEPHRNLCKHRDDPPIAGRDLADPAELAAILEHPDVAPSLREWTTISRVVGEVLTGAQQDLGNDSLQRIGSEESAGR